MVSVIFDFDGTLANTEKVYIEIAKEVEPLFRARIAEGNEDIGEFKSLPIRELLKKYNVSYFHLLRKVWQGRKLFPKYANEIDLFNGIRDVLDFFKNSNFELYILSTNSKVNITTVLTKENVLNFFKEIRTERMIFGKSRVLNKMIKKMKIDNNKTIYVGDEIRDIEACKKTGIKSIAVTWGFNTKELLQSANPDFIAENPTDLIKIITDFKNSVDIN